MWLQAKSGFKWNLELGGIWTWRLILQQAKSELGGMWVQAESGFKRNLDLCGIWTWVADLRFRRNLDLGGMRVEA